MSPSQLERTALGVTSSNNRATIISPPSFEPMNLFQGTAAQPHHCLKHKRLLAISIVCSSKSLMELPEFLPPLIASTLYKCCFLGHKITIDAHGVFCEITVTTIQANSQPLPHLSLYSLASYRRSDSTGRRSDRSHPMSAQRLAGRIARWATDGPPLSSPAHDSCPAAAAS